MFKPNIILLYFTLRYDFINSSAYCRFQSVAMTARKKHFYFGPSGLVVSNIIFRVLFVLFSYCGTLFLIPTIAFFFSWLHQKKRREISALTFVFALTQCAVVSYTFFSTNNLQTRFSSFTCCYKKFYFSPDKCEFAFLQ